MDWVLHHLQLIIAAAGAVAWWLNQRRQAKEGGAAAPSEATFDDPELAERTRRIREEIQRKIEERAGRYVNEPPTRPLDAPVARAAVTRTPEPPPLSRATAARLETERTDEMLERQALLTEQLRLAEEMKAAVAQRTQFETKVLAGSTAATVARSALAEDLKNPDALRRAFVLREVLGPPLSLR